MAAIEKVIGGHPGIYADVSQERRSCSYCHPLLSRLRTRHFA